MGVQDIVGLFVPTSLELYAKVYFMCGNWTSWF